MENYNETFYEHLIISGEDYKFQEDLTKASIDGWEVTHINSFPVNKPDYIKNSINVIIVYTAVLRRIRNRKELKENDSTKQKNEQTESMD